MSRSNYHKAAEREGVTLDEMVAHSERQRKELAKLSQRAEAFRQERDALAARLAEAERLLRGWCDHPHSYAMLRSTDKFLQQSTADSASEATHGSRP